MHPAAKKSLLASSVAFTLGSVNANAALVSNVLGPYDWFTDSANWTFLASNGGVVGGVNDVAIAWDGNAYSAISDYTGPGSASNVTASTTTFFLGHAWTSHDIQMFLPGSYTFDTALGGGNPEFGSLNVTVNAGQLGMHMLWDWNGNLNVDVFVAFSQNSIFGSGLLYSTTTSAVGARRCDANYLGTIVKNCLIDGANFGSAGAPTKNQIWTLASTDPDGDDVMGVPMSLGGPWPGFNFNLNANLTPTPNATVPIPAAAWLFGSGLLGLVGITYRKRKFQTP